MHLGGTRILGMFKVTMDGKDGVQMMQIVKPKKTIPIHYNDYDVFKSPLAEFAREVKAAGMEESVVYLSHGDTYTFIATQALNAHPPLNSCGMTTGTCKHMLLVGSTASQALTSSR